MPVSITVSLQLTFRSSATSTKNMYGDEDSQHRREEGGGWGNRMKRRRCMTYSSKSQADVIVRVESRRKNGTNKNEYVRGHGWENQ